MPRGENLFEWTRFFVIPELREPRRSCRAAGIVYCGILEFCLGRQIRTLSIVCDDYWFDRLAALGWNPQRLGKPLAPGRAIIVGLTVDMTPAALVTTRRAYATATPVLVSGNGVRPPQVSATAAATELG